MTAVNQSMMTHSPIGMVVFDDKGDVVTYNLTALSILKLDKPVESIKQFSDQIQRSFHEVLQKEELEFRSGSLRIWLRYYFEDNQKQILLTICQDPEYFELEKIILESFDEILVTDEQGTITKISSRCKELYGLSAEDLIGKNTKELEEKGIFTPSLTPKVLERKEKVSSIQMTCTGKKLYVIGNPIFDEDGNLYRIIFNSREVSEIEALESRLYETEALLDQYKKELKHLKQIVSDQKDIVYKSKSMKQVYELAEKVAQVDSTVLIVGETGVGKGMMARYIHQESSRKDYKMIEINCGAIPENLIESELFGYEGGAFTGAQKEGKKGVIELAEGGTLFLDEVGELPLHVQVKLLQFLQDKKFRRVGGREFVQVDTRIIAATNQDLTKLVKEKKFREDLYYRLNVIPISIPPLRHRKEDIPVLADYLLTRLNAKYDLNKKMEQEVYQTFMKYSWPGNVRELENLIERLFVTSEGKRITCEDLPPHLKEEQNTKNGLVVKDIYPLKQAVEEVEKQLISMAYQTYKNTYKCAEVLEVNQSTIVRKMKKYSFIPGGSSHDHY